MTSVQGPHLVEAMYDFSDFVGCPILLPLIIGYVAKNWWELWYNIRKLMLPSPDLHQDNKRSLKASYNLFDCFSGLKMTPVPALIYFWRPLGLFLIFFFLNKVVSVPTPEAVKRKPISQIYLDTSNEQEVGLSGFIGLFQPHYSVILP